MTPTLTCSRCGSALVRNSAAGAVCPVCVFRDALTLEATVPADASARPPPRRFGSYELIEEIGRGGMGVVYRARQLPLGREVAVKLLLAGAHASEADLRRFQVEAAAPAGLQHPGILAIHDFGECDGQPYYTMDLVRGPNLAQLCDGRPLASPRAAELLLQVTQAIRYAHERGVLHRDLKPSNVLVDPPGRARIGDFGLAKVMGSTSTMTLSGLMLGSPSYVAPEQAAGRAENVSVAVDVYGLGAVLYHLITGRAPFVAATATETLRLVLDTEPAAPHLLNPSLPRDLETICLRCLQKDPAGRYTSAAALADDLERFLTHRPIQARPVSPFVRAWQWCRRHPAVATLTALLAAVLVASTVVSQLQTRRVQQAWDRAEQAQQAAIRSRDEAERIVVWLLEDLGSDLESAGRRSQVLALARQVVDHYEQLPAEQHTRETRRRHAQALAHLGYALTALSQFDAAQVPAREAVQRLQRLREEGDDSEATAVAWANALTRLVALAGRTGHGNEAIALAERAVAGIEPQASKPGASAESRGSLARALTNLGYHWGRGGDRSRAVACGERALTVLRDAEAAGLSTRNLLLETALAASFLQSMLDRTQTQDRRALLDEGVRAAQRVLTEQPVHETALALLATLEAGIAGSEASELNLRAALRWRQRELETRDRLHAIDPAHLDNLHYRIRARGAIRHLGAGEGQVSAAIAGWREELEQRSELAGAVLQRAMVAADWGVLAHWLARQGDRRGAEHALQQVFAAVERADADSPRDNPHRPANRLRPRFAAADVAFELGDLARARDEAQAVLALLAATPDPTSADAVVLFDYHARRILAWAQVLGDDHQAAAATNPLPRPGAGAIYPRYFAGIAVPQALALARLGRFGEAQAILVVETEFLREACAANSGHCAVLEELARALTVEAIAQPPAAAGRRHQRLTEAATLIATMTDEYRDLPGVRQLSRWIRDEQAGGATGGREPCSDGR